MKELDVPLIIDELHDYGTKEEALRNLLNMDKQIIASVLGAHKETD